MPNKEEKAKKSLSSEENSVLEALKEVKKSLSREEKFMLEALKEANKALAKDEVPIGAVVVFENKIIARGHNQKEKTQIATKHAEVIAIEKACKKVGSWRLCDCELFVTLEPCPMCSSLITQSRIENLYYGATDEKGGGVSLFDIFNCEKLNHKTYVESGVLNNQCSQILKDYFKMKRERNRQKKLQKKSME